MNGVGTNPEVSLIASPYDLRVSLGERVSDPDIRAALESGALKSSSCT